MAQVFSQYETLIIPQCVHELRCRKRPSVDGYSTTTEFYGAKD